MRRLAASVVVVLAALGLPVLAEEDDKQGPIEHVATFDDGGKYRQGSDLAFWGNIAVLGSYDNPGGFRLLDVSNPAKPRLLGRLACPGPQNDVAVWENLVILSVDSMRSDSSCSSTSVSQAQALAGQYWEGIRIVSIADPAKPRVLANVETDCGSHTHTVVPDLAKGRILVYALSYPLTSGLGPKCNIATHRKISVVEVPLDKPADARVISTPGVGPVIGCHDVTVMPEQKLAAAACLSESQMWDISDPVNPVVIAHIRNPQVNIHHSSAFSWDAKTIVIGDELGGAAFTPGCMGEGHVPLGALWFYDVTDPRAPVQKGYFRIGNSEQSLFCTAHNFNVVPTRNERDILVTGWYNGGTAVVDFTDPSAPAQLAAYAPKTGVRAASWSSYWYNGYIYANNFDDALNGGTSRSRGFDVFRFTHASVAGALTLPSLNAQTQLPLPSIVVPAAKPRSTVAGSTSNPRPSAQEPALPATGVGMPVAGPVLVGAAAAAAAFVRRRR